MNLTIQDRCNRVTRSIRLLNNPISSILLFVNRKHYRVLRFVLIILLMLAPFRTLMAMSSPHCDMADMSASQPMDKMPSGASRSHHHPTASKAVVKHKCCCCDTGKCAGNCDMGMSVSLTVQDTFYAPVIVAITDSVIISSAILIRALTPLTRPPANYS
jgi:uncharacterized membrane protein